MRVLVHVHCYTVFRRSEVVRRLISMEDQQTLSLANAPYQFPK